jgi:DNA-binding transcriptional ArsR family regulator
MVLPAISFRLEREMMEPVTSSLLDIMGAPPSTAIQVLREPSIGNVIPDLLIGIGAGPNLKGGGRSYRTSRIDAHVMTLLESHRSISAACIADTIFMSRAAVDQTLIRLSRAGVVRKTRTGTWRLCAQHRSLAVEIVAFELKLSRWHDALRQAIQYLQFADWSYVVLDGNRVRETPQIRSAFLSTGIGLFFQYGFSTVRAVEPRRNNPRPTVARVLSVSKLFGGSPLDCRRIHSHVPSGQNAPAMLGTT